MDSGTPEDEDFPGRLLHQAALWDNAELLCDLLGGDQAAHVDSRDSWGRTPLHAAATTQRSRCLPVLLKAGADPNIPCGPRGENRTALHVSAEHGDRDNVAALLDAGADLLARDVGGLTALDVADKADHKDCMTLLKETADERVRERNERHATLREHCLSGDAGKAKEVLDSLGSDAELVVNMAPGGSNTILFSSCEAGHKDVVRLLLKRGADGRIHPVTRYSPLYIACYNGRKDIAELLLQKFPELVEQSTVEQWLPLHACCINGHASTLQLLLSFQYPQHLLHTYSCARDEWTYEMAFDINAGDATGQSALYVACLLGSLPPAETLLAFRVPATRRRAAGEERTSPTRGRRISGGIGAIMARLSLSALGESAAAPDGTCQLSPLRLDALCNGGSETALHAAVRGRHADVARLLLAAGADPNVASRPADADEPPAGTLLPATRHRDVGLVDLLLKHGGRDDECRALKVAASNRDDLLIARLLSVKAYADPDYKLNKTAMPEHGVFSQLAHNAGLTYSSLFPSTPAMVNWHNQRCGLAQIRQEWLVEAALTVNPRLRLNPKHPTVALHAITRIDLSQNSLVYLPLTLFQLQSLRSLNVAQNKIEKLPDPEPTPPTTGVSRKKAAVAASKAGYGAPVLEELYLQDNRLEWINAEVFRLPSLTTLDVSNNKLQALPCEMWRAQQLKELNASFNLLRDLPWEPTPVLGELASPMSPTEPSLPSRFSDIDVTEDQLTDARSLQLSLSVQQLDVVRHNLWARQVEVTEQVVRGGGEEDDVTPGDRCSQLSALNLAHNQFAAVPACLACLAVRLTRLNLSYNCLGSMSHITSYPGGLKQLDLSHNNISVWPSLPGLDALDSSVACFAPKDAAASQCLPPGPGGRRSLRCAVLRRVCAHRRQLRLDALRTLVLADNLLARVQLATDDDGSVSEDDDGSDWDLIGGSGKSRLMFPNLSMLDVSNNRLSEVPAAIHELSNLSVLNVSGNHDICELPPQMGLLTRLWNLNTRGCSLQEPLKSMIDSKKFKTMDVVGYLRSVLEDARPYARMKLMLVGVAGIGKTSLLDQLRSEGSFKRRQPEHWAKRMGNKNINTKTSRGVNMSTVGVDIADWCYEKKVRGSSSHGPVVFRTWDFGGQREYYATHQYFLSKRSLYLVVWKIPDGAKAISEILHWLVSIQARAPNSPVLIIGTHYDLMRETLPSSRSEDLQQVIREKFINIVDAEKCGLPRVLDTIEVSCKTRHNVKLLCNLIYDTVFSLKPPGSKELLLEQRVPAIYLSLEDAVGHLAAERRNAGADPVMTAEQFRLAVATEMQRRNQRPFRDPAELRQAALFLHDNGVLLHYEDATLKDLYFLDPQWLCDMLAHVVTIREINPFASSGVMRLEDLPLVFKSSTLGPSDTRSYVVGLLNKFEVALGWDARTLLIPSLLPAEDSGHSLPTRVKIPMRSRGWSLRSKKPSQTASPAATLVGNSQFYAPSSSPVPEASTASLAESDRSIRRLLLMSYFPAGFWPRLITRLLADDAIVDIVRSFFVTPKDMVFDAALVQQMDVPPEWLLWQTGMELRCGDVTLFRMKELLPSVRCAPVDYRALRYRLQQEGAWTDTGLTGSSALEILVPRQPLTLSRPMGAAGADADAGVQRVVLEPSSEGAARLLALAVDHVDLLLEDWYPTLGTRFVHTSEGRFLVTRLVPCPRCLLELAAETPAAPPADEIEEALARREAARSSLGSSDRDSGVDPDSAHSSRVSSMEGHPGLSSSPPEPSPPCFSWVIEECILAACDRDTVACPAHGDISLAAIAPDTMFLDLGERHLIRAELVTRGPLLGRGAFGFVFRGSCELRGSRQVVPVALKMLQPVPPGAGARQSALIAFKGAQGKWSRDPVQHACKAHCTARQELGVLLALRHAHIVPLVGVVTRPLALVLALAPRGALDAALRDFRRSGARLDPATLQALILQAAKAVEYLHQQRVIYRDLKSENVLVWQLPAPFQAGPAGTHIKLADYGISRQALPSGAKGFGGTEGFMAPEIMRFNGEEEYTEKVDCFSFGMFVYELLTLHQPFEGHEAVKECILEGGRPSLTYRETLHPSYMLDLMVMCWAQSPRDRPSASQIVSIASAPEFPHLVDAVSLGTADVFATAAAAAEGEGGSWTVWISCAAPRCHLLSVTTTGVVGHSSLPVARRVTAAAAVGGDVWLGDAAGSLHCYRGSTGEKRWSYALESDSALVALAALPASRVAAALANGRLFVLAAEGPAGASTALGSFVLTELGSAVSLHALAALDLAKCCHLWCGESDGGVSVFTMSEGVVTAYRPLRHPEPLGQVLLLVATPATSDAPAAVYSYVYPGCVVYQWDPESLEIRSRLDVSKLVPCSESLKSISIEEHLSPGKCQVSSLATLDGQLYIGTAWGCVVVAQCGGLRPVTVFRPLGGAVAALLPLPPRRALFAGRGHRSLVARYVAVQAHDSDDVVATVWQTTDWAPV